MFETNKHPQREEKVAITTKSDRRMRVNNQVCDSVDTKLSPV